MRNLSIWNTVRLKTPTYITVIFICGRLQTKKQKSGRGFVLKTGKISCLSSLTLRVLVFIILCLMIDLISSAIWWLFSRLERLVYTGWHTNRRVLLYRILGAYKSGKHSFRGLGGGERDAITGFYIKELIYVDFTKDESTHLTMKFFLNNLKLISEVLVKGFLWGESNQKSCE